MGLEDHSRPHPTMIAHILLLLLASSVLGDPDSVGRQPRHRRRLCSLGTCQTHRLPEMIYWLRSASIKEHSGKAGREPQDPHSYGRRRRREARVLLRLQDLGLKKRGQRSAQLPG
ncbi:putative adrenomedullin-5-like protein [Zalophus californianus]|uniref:Adrenomedullin-5-like protein n=1 Tax=Zalophus californianus TaxID=9704 RepID=A0A6J2F580_ZALCA|nr:putative adrenomedullin-5-like protein [Zalophus californianus]XP_027947405.1 putative adrenomedullin-5-like protein [Eumetopias jubatus]